MMKDDDRMSQPESALNQTPPSGHFAAVNGIELYYQLCGLGSPLVLLHGFSKSSRDFEPFVPDLAECFQLVVADMRGHGRSTNPSNEFTHRQSALDIYALLDELGIDRFKAIGISSGGMTLLHMATKQPERVDAMVLVGATSYLPEQARAINREVTVDGDQVDWEQARKRHVYGDDQIRSLINQFHGFKDSYDDVNFTPPYLSTITASTLIVHGDRDEFFPVVIPLEMYTAIPNAYLWIIPNGGHSDFVEERSAALKKIVLEFLRGEWEATSSACDRTRAVRKAVRDDRNGEDGDGRSVRGLRRVLRLGPLH